MGRLQRAPAVPRAGDAAGEVKNIDPALFVDQPYDARWWRQFDDPILEQLEATRCDEIRSEDGRVSRQPGTRRLRRRRARSIPDRDSWRDIDRGEQVIPGFTEEPIADLDLPGRLRRFWELDLFGRVRSAVRAASASAESFTATLDDVRVSVAAEVARNYFELRGLQQQFAVAERSLANQRETLRLTRVRRDGGVGEEQDVASAAARVAAIEASFRRSGRPSPRVSTGSRCWPACAQASSPWTSRRDPIHRSPKRCRSEIPDCCCSGGPMCGRRNATSPPPRRAKALPPPSSFPASASRVSSAFWPAAAACSAAPTRVHGP